VPVYDRSLLIRRAIDNAGWTLVEVVLTVVFIVLLFLWHVPSALIPLITIPVAVLVAFIPFRWLGLTVNIMALGGIAIAMGELVDAAIVVAEQTHKKLEEAARRGDTIDARAVVLDAVKEVAPASFFALLVIAVSFLPVLTLEAQEGRLFKPLAYTKTLAMLVAAGLVLTLDPALRVMFTRVRRLQFQPAWLCRLANAVFVGRIRSEEHHPITRVLVRIYEPVVRWSLRWKWAVVAGAAALVVLTIPIFNRLGSEFMPPLDEGSLFYMPTTMPGIAIGEAQRLLQTSNQAIRQFPEVDRVLGKAGRADSSTDSAPLSMLETVITLKPRSEWRRVDTWYSGWAPEWLKPVLRRITDDRISQDDLIREMDAALQYPGVSNAWTMPIKGRIDMVTTGIRTPVGLKISGADSRTIEDIGARIEALLPSIEGTRNVFAERAASGYFLDIEWNRVALARYGLGIDAAQALVQNAIGGENVTSTVEGRERYPVNVRYMSDFRSDVDAIGRVLVPAPGGRQVPLAELAQVSVATGPSMIRNEDGLVTGYVLVDVDGSDIAGYVERARQLVRERIQLPPGYAVLWSGQYEAMARVRERVF
jgi:Cu(I)/Ag(I) efflux system membrane protein CusA/SilA